MRQFSESKHPAAALVSRLKVATLCGLIAVNRSGLEMIRELKTFICVAQKGTFAAAGQHVGLTQSAVSAQIKNLEDTLGVKLFDRTGRAATLNSAGQRAIPLGSFALSSSL